MFCKENTTALTAFSLVSLNGERRALEATLNLELSATTARLVLATETPLLLDLNWG